MNELRWDAQELCHWAEWGRIEERLPDLLRPHGLRWPESAEQLLATLAQLSPRIPEPWRHLPAQALVAAALGRPAERPPWVMTALADAQLLPGLELGLSWAELAAMDWSRFAIALADSQRARLVWALVGLAAGELATGWPGWWPAVADAEAVRATTKALELIRRRTGKAAYFWPILAERKQLALYGGSLGLPLVLAGLGLAQGTRPGHTLATGCLDDSGQPAPVGALDNKLKLAADAGFRVLLYASGPDLTRLDAGAVEAVPVSSLDQAYRFWRLHAQSGGRGLARFASCCRDPRELADSLPVLDPCLVESPSGRASYRSCLAELVRQPHLCSRLADTLEGALDQPAPCWDALAGLLAPLGPELVTAAAACAALAAFRLAQVQLALANHRGDPAESAAWGALSERLAPRIQNSPDGWKQFFRHCNRSLIHGRHNRYRFGPQLPESAASALRTLEHLAEARRSILPLAVDPELGAFHGTLAQHFGFCGAPYRDRLEHHVRVAQAAYGDGELVETRDDWRRQFNYLLYALLDSEASGGSGASGGTTGAVAADQALEHYLDCNWRALTEPSLDHLGPFQHAALARFLADRGERFDAYLRWAERHLRDRPHRHPWQLWLYNVGRLLPSMEGKRRAWRLALKQCRTSPATIRAMSLLPMAALRHQGCADASQWLREAAELLAWLPQSGLDRDHFGPLTAVLYSDAVPARAPAARTALTPATAVNRGQSGTAAADAALALVAAQPARFFPFTYR